MTEPVSSSVAAVKIYTLMVVLGISAALAYLVVIMTRLPRTTEEWVVSLVTTVVGSIGGGAYTIQYFGLHAYAQNWFGMCALGGIVFVAGLPFWAIARWTFNYINQREHKNIIEIVSEIKKEIKGDK